MTPTEQAILATLDELDAAVQGLRQGNSRPDLPALFRRLDELAGCLPADAAPDLRHYLERKSYEKVRLFLRGRGGENARGSCGRS